jgi:hypothetical protein
MQLFCRVAFGEPRRISISINRITELEALGILWLELRAGAAAERGSKGRLKSFWIAHGCLKVVWPAQYAWDLRTFTTEFAIIPSALRKRIIILEL